MVLVADLGADGTHAHPVHHLTRVTVVPVLVHKLLLSDGKGAQFVVKGLLVLLKGEKEVHVNNGNCSDFM